MKSLFIKFILLSVVMLLSTSARAQGAVQYDDEASFLAAVDSPSVIDFEGYADPGSFVFLGDPGIFQEQSVSIYNNSQMFIQNNDFYGTDSFLSPQGANPQFVTISLPRATGAVGFSYRSAQSAPTTATVNDNLVYDLDAVPPGSFAFFGLTQDEPILSVRVTVSGPGIDIDNVYFETTSPPIIPQNPVSGGGQIDTSFGDNGLLLIDEIFANDTTASAAMAVQPNGKIVLAVAQSPEELDPFITVFRIDTSGAVDTSFATDGFFSIDMGAGLEQPEDIEILDDSSILIVGGTGITQSNLNQSAMIIKLDGDGNLDTSFGTNGTLIDDLILGRSKFYSIAVQNDGKLLLGAGPDGLYRLLANGSRDTTFGNNGRALGLRTGDAPFVAEQDSDGTIIAGGGNVFAGGPQDFLIYTFFGTNDHTGDPGEPVPFYRAEITIGPGTDSLIDLAIDEQGRIYGLGYSDQGSTDSALIRLLPSGVLDTTFGTNGIKFLDLPTRGFDARRVRVRPDGGVLVAGAARVTGELEKYELFVMSLLEDGSLDTSFAGQGYQELDTGLFDQCPNCVFLSPDRAGIEFHPDGKIAILDEFCSCMMLLEAPTWDGAEKDSDGDGRSDILWRNDVSGQNWLYLMDGSTITSSVGINTVPTSWAIAGNGDYDGDGKADILWRNSVTGQNWMYLMDSSAVVSSVGINTVPTSWAIAGNGDYDGDGKADILWRNSVTGQNWMYLMDGAAVVSSVGINTVADTNWQVQGSGDFDGDGKSDILWRNSSTGQDWLYLMDGATIASSTGINTVADLNWKVVGVGDYDGDGKADILWRNSVTGQNWMYLMNGSTITSSVVVNTVPTSWSVVGSGDYNGDGKSDILWRNTVTGQNWMYLMDGATISNSASVNTVGDLNWEIVNVH